MPGLLLKLTHAALQLAASAHSKNIIDLTGDAWTLTNQQGNISIPGSVPSYSQLDLFAAGVIGDPLIGDNDVFDNWVGTSNWTYTSHPITRLEKTASTYLVFEGIDTFATISFCNTAIAAVNNQFRQWIFDVTPVFASCPTAHLVLSLEFTAAPIEAAYLNNPNVSDISCPACIEAEGAGPDVDPIVQHLPSCPHPILFLNARPIIYGARSIIMKDLFNTNAIGLDCSKTYILSIPHRHTPRPRTNDERLELGQLRYHR